MLTAILIGLIGALGVMDFQFGSLYINRPIVLGPLVGLVLGDVTLRFTDRYAEEGKYAGIVATHWMIGMLNVLRRFLLVFFAFYLGVDKMQGLIDAIPTVLIDGMDAAAGLLPALGFAMLMRMILNKQIIPYFFLGFICAAYLGMPVLGVAILGLIIVVVQFGFLNPKKETTTASINEEVDDDDF